MDIQCVSDGVFMNEQMRTVRIVLADDHPIVLMAVSDQFAKLPGYQIAATVN